MTLSKPTQADHRRCGAAFADAEHGEALAGAAETEGHMLHPLCNTARDARALEPRLQQSLSNGGPPT